MKPFAARNQTPSARRKLASLAKASALSPDLVSMVASFTWDYDPTAHGAPIGWVRDDDGPLSPEASAQLENVAQALGLSPDVTVGASRAIADLTRVHRETSVEPLWSGFLSAAVRKNYGWISELASHQYLRGLDPSRAATLGAMTKELRMPEIARNLFLKLFRGGSIERADLGYLWCDLAIPLPYVEAPSPAPSWLDDLLRAIEELPPRSGLKDLIDCCRQRLPGDKFFKQEVLQVLSYADVLRVDGLAVTQLFLPERRHEPSPHFYSNEWSFPLRFWSTRGGTVNREAVPGFARP